MSGGVDSSVAAALLLRQGFDVVGVTLHLWDYPDDDSARGRCCAPEDVHDARRVADVLGFPHFAFDRRELFRTEVIEPFVDGYLGGVTPSPCVRCNRGVKIRELLGLANRLGAAQIATGHYARIAREEGVARLYRGRDPKKDQSYFLHMLPQEILSRLVFPLGELTKAEVRQEALNLDLPGAQKGESQELCFVPTGRYDAFVAERATGRLRPGTLVDAAGQSVGEHAGTHGYTVGQRHHLGVALGYRAYVVAVEPEAGIVRLGRREQLLSSGAKLAEAVLADDFALPGEAEVAVRYSPQAVPCEVTRTLEGALQVAFKAPLASVVPGQYAVFYRGERVLGGGLIVESVAASNAHEPMESLT